MLGETRFKLIVVIFLLISSLIPLWPQMGLTINADGKVGVMTDTPAADLDVAGDLNISGVTGNANIEGDLAVTGIVSAKNVLFVDMEEVHMTMPTRATQFAYADLPSGFTCENTYILDALVYAPNHDKWFPVFLTGYELYMRVYIKSDDQIALMNRWSTDTFDVQNDVKILLVRVD